jgi:hypothetical protein
VWMATTRADAASSGAPSPRIPRADMSRLGIRIAKPVMRRAELLVLPVWAWVELNYRPHAYQATAGE